MAEKRKKKRRKKVVKYRRPITINVGFVVFAAIFTYVLVYMIMYFSRDRISIYEVVYGKDADMTNKTYTALLLRTETAVAADTSGYLNYYVRSGERTSVGKPVYTIDEDGKVQEYLVNNDDGMTLNDEDYDVLRQSITDYTLNYDPYNFSETYDFKIDMSSTLLECANMNVINDKLAELNLEGTYNYVLHRSALAGIVEYYTDGYESKQVNEISMKDFDLEKYSRKNIMSGGLIAAGDMAYKVIGDENWKLVIPLDEKDVEALTGDTRIRIRFLQDGTEVTGNFEILNQNDGTFGLITLNKYMLKYASSRFQEIEIVENELEGLKIPKTSVVSKNFFVIPFDYNVAGEEGEFLFTKEVYDEEENSMTVTTVSPRIYYVDEENMQYYVDDNDFTEGDALKKTDSNETYIVRQTASLEGVYNVNSGYCIFRLIEKLAETGDYYLIHTGTDYGLKVYDHIVIDGSMVNEEDVVFK